MRKTVICLILSGVALGGTMGCQKNRGSKTAPELASNGAEPTTVVPARPVVEEKIDDTPTVLKDKRPLIVCFGDSLTAGYGADEGSSYPDFLQKDLDAAGYHYRVDNEGVSGNTTKDGVDRLAGIVAMKPQVVVLEFGGNDGLRGLKVETTKANLAAMIDGLKKGGAKVALAGITLPPDYGPDYVNAFTANYAALAKTFKVPLLPFLLANVYGVPGMMQGDRTHATDKGNQVVARDVMGLVGPLLVK